jgi:hypothetical protein
MRENSAIGPADRPSEWMTTHDLAAYLGLPVRTVQICYKGWGLEPARIGKFLLFNRAEVEAILAGRRVTP